MTDSERKAVAIFIIASAATGFGFWQESFGAGFWMFWVLVIANEFTVKNV